MAHNKGVGEVKQSLETGPEMTDLKELAMWTMWSGRPYGITGVTG